MAFTGQSRSGARGSELGRIIRIYGSILAASLTLLAISDWLGREEGVPTPTPAEWGHALTHEWGVAGLIVVMLAFSFERISKREFEHVASGERTKSVEALKEAADTQLGHAREELARIATEERQKSVDEVRRAASGQLEVARDEFARLFLDERALMKKDVYVGVFGKRIPEPVRDAIEVQLLESSFGRRNAELTYWLYPVQAADATWYMSVRVEAKYEIENLSYTGETKTLELTPFVSKAPEGLEDQVGFLSFSATGCKQPFSLTREELTALTFDRDVDRVLCLAPKHTIEVTAEPTTISIQSAEIDHLRSSRQSFVARHFITDLTLTVYTPNCGPHIKVQAKANAFKQLAKEVALPELGYFRWKTTGPLLPLQGINVHWWYTGTPQAAT
jgi:hypothetical protein